MDLKQRIDAFADIGWEGYGDDQGRDCLPYSENEDLAFDEFGRQAQRLIEMGRKQGLDLIFRVDPFKNAYLVLKGRSERQVMICSHLDSVIRGGRYDGVTGVASGLDVVQKFVAQGECPKKTIVVTAFRAEESSVTGMSCIGSSLATGEFSISKLREVQHRSLEKSLIEILGENGLDEKDLDEYRARPYINAGQIDAVLELHIEQSNVLNGIDEPFGIVIHGIGGSRRSRLKVEDTVNRRERAFEKRVRVTVKGRADHSGGTPMNGELIGGKEMRFRKDALLAVACYLINREGSTRLSYIGVPKGSFNQVPGECVFDLILEDGETVDDIEQGMGGYVCVGMDYKVEELESEDVEVIRENVVQAAMEIVLSVENIASRLAKSTKGRIRATIGAVNMQKNGLELLMDQRRLNEQFGRHMVAYVRDQIVRIQRELSKVDIKEENVVNTVSVPFKGDIQARMRTKYWNMHDKAPVELGSMPGHDAAKIINARRDGSYVPGGMVYVRSRNGGISHHPSEYSHQDDIDLAADFLYEVVKEL